MLNQASLVSPGFPAMFAVLIAGDRVVQLLIVTPVVT